MRKYEETKFFVDLASKQTGEFDHEFLCEFANTCRYYFYPSTCKQVLEKILKVKPDCLSAHYIQVRILQRQQMKDLAKKKYLEIKERFPLEKHTLNNLCTRAHLEGEIMDD